jgi:hypothetical protein
MVDPFATPQTANSDVIVYPRPSLLRHQYTLISTAESYLPTLLHATLLPRPRILLLNSAQALCNPGILHSNLSFPHLKPPTLPIRIKPLIGPSTLPHLFNCLSLPIQSTHPRLPPFSPSFRTEPEPYRDSAPPPKWEPPLTAEWFSTRNPLFLYLATPTLPGPSSSLSDAPLPGLTASTI